MNEKMENILNVAKELPEDELEKSAQLSAGFDVQEDLWEVIVRFSGDPAFLREYPEVSYAVLSNNFAILKLPAELIDTVADHPNIIYMEKPKPLYFSVAANRSEACVNSVQNQFGLYGEGVLIAVIDSGIDYAHPAFLTPEGRTRIRAIWDQTEERGEPPTTLFEVRGSRSPIRGSEYTAEQINEALSADQDSYTVVSSFDRSGHGTHVAGIAAGNFANDRRNQVGFATKSELLVVKLALPQERSFPTTVELMEAIDYSVRKAVQMKMPLVINLSFGNNYGSHDGTSLLESYINEIAAREQVTIVIGAGNEGNAGGHTSGILRSGDREAVEIAVSTYQMAMNLQIWKNYADEFELEVQSPGGRRTGILAETNEVSRYRFAEEGTDLLVYYGTAKPYSIYQEIYLEFMPVDTFIRSGIWTVMLYGVRSAVGEYHMWLPVEAALGTSTRFLLPQPDTTMTIPSTATAAVTVGAYDSNQETYADFSGRGFTRETRQVKPELVAPGVNIRSAAAGGGLTVKSGTSMAAPMVSGAAAMLMEWGIVRGNDPFLYGQKLKAYLLRGARQLPGENIPSKKTGFGALCLRNSIPG